MNDHIRILKIDKPNSGPIYVSKKPSERKAYCFQCGRESSSDSELPFFKYQEDKDFDIYYCGDAGWD